MSFPVINHNIIISKESKLILDLNTGLYIDMDDSGLFVLECIDGKKSITDIFNHLAIEYNIDYAQLMRFLQILQARGIITISDEPGECLVPNKDNIRIASIELTDKCNIKCRYCYGAFAPANCNFYRLEEIIPLFKTLKARGVKVVELTGGEPTVNPQFNEIFELACNTFDNVTVMSNAVHFQKETLELFRIYRKKLSFSISIDGFSEETNAFQRQVKNTFTKTINNITYINKQIQPKNIRVVYMLTNENKKELDSFYQYMANEQIRDVVISIPEHIEDGRCYNLPDGCDMSDRTSWARQELNEEAERVAEKYKDEIYPITKKLGIDGIRLGSAHRSCGAGWALISIKSNGDIVPCNMMNNYYKLGNAKLDPTLDFLSRDNSVYDLFSKVDISFEDSKRDCCKQCEYYNFCFKCINKIIIANRKRIAAGLQICPVLANNGFTEEIIKNK